jgi:Co/Zn/Cd efflux system component
MIEALFISSILLIAIGLLILIGKEKKIIINPITKKQRIVVGIALLFTGFIASFSCYLALYSENPTWLLDEIFSIFT